MKLARNCRGAALIAALVTLLAVTLVAGAVVRLVFLSQRQAGQYEHELQAQWLAEAGISRALAQLAQQPAYSGETWQPVVNAKRGDEQPAQVEISIDSPVDPPGAAAEKIRCIVVVARYPNHEWRRATVRREHFWPSFTASSPFVPRKDFLPRNERRQNPEAQP